MDTDPNQRISQVEREVHQLNAAFNTLSQGQSELRAIQQSHGERLDKIGIGVDKLIEERGNRGMSLAQVGGAIAALATLFFANAEYLQLHLVPLRDADQRFDRALDVFTEFRTQTHHEFGKIFEHQTEITKRFEHFDSLYHDLDKRVQEEESKSSAAEVSRRSMGDYLRDIGRKVYGD